MREEEEREFIVRTGEEVGAQIASAAIEFVKRNGVDVFVHWPTEPLHVVIDNPTPRPPQATHAVLLVEGKTMADFTIDQTGKKGTVSFTDDRGDPVAPPTSGSVVFSSDNAGVATVAADPSNPWACDLTWVAPGSFNLTANLQGVMKADGTPVADPTPVPVNVTGGAASVATLTVA